MDISDNERGFAEILSGIFNVCDGIIANGGESMAKIEVTMVRHNNVRREGQKKLTVENHQIYNVTTDGWIEADMWFEFVENDKE
ncbi:hypothetical protein [Mesorhizobium sp. IMUNJ 23232]|uniref:hypothetical protein n=1 Tax=Mesorhizobium sp. IMUNJ 23232 TaxID=3376064 RepID=UPI0037951ECE